MVAPRCLHSAEICVHWIDETPNRIDIGNRSVCLLHGPERGLLPRLVEKAIIQFDLNITETGGYIIGKGGSCYPSAYSGRRSYDH